MPRQNCQRKPGTTRGSPRWAHTAKTSRISRPAVKSGWAREWDGWGRISEDGPGQHNPARSEGPWGRAADAARMTVLVRATPLAQNGGSVSASGEYEGGTQTRRCDTWTPHGAVRRQNKIWGPTTPVVARQNRTSGATITVPSLVSQECDSLASGKFIFQICSVAIRARSPS